MRIYSSWLHGNIGEIKNVIDKFLRDLAAEHNVLHISGFFNLKRRPTYRVELSENRFIINKVHFKCPSLVVKKPNSLADFWA